MTVVSEPAPVSARLKRPAGLVEIRDVLRYLQGDRFMPLQVAADYVGMRPRKLREILPAELRFRVSSKKILVRRSELDEFMERFRERPQGLERIVNDVVEDVLQKSIAKELP